jgi:hypothetical protein
MFVLRILRSKKTAKKIWIALAIVIIPAFCFWGFGSALRDRKESAFVGKVFGKSISKQEYLRNYKAIRDLYLIQLGQEQLAKLEKYLNLNPQVWERIILLSEAKRMNISVSNQEVVDSIKQYPFFQRKGGFDPEVYQDTITYVFRTNPRVFEEEIRDNLTIAKLHQKVTANISIDEDEIKDAYIKQNEQISLEYILVQIQDFINQVAVEEEELVDYYNSNPGKFKKSLSYNLEYIKSGDKDNQTISRVTQLLKQGFSLQNIAKDTGLELKQTGLFSDNEPIPQIGWSTEILKILPQLKPKGKPWPKPIHTDANIVYFVSLDEKKEPYIQPFDDVREQVNQMLRQQKAKQTAQERLNACYNEAEIVGFKESAKEFNLKTGKTELFKPRGYVEGLGNSDVFFDAVQDLKEGQISKILNTPSGFCIVKLLQRIKPDEEEFNQEKEKFSNNLLEQKKQEYFNQFLTDLRDKANLSISLPDL